MAIELRQHLKLTQQLILTPQLQMAIKLLQLSRLELMDTIRMELEENPTLEDGLDGSSGDVTDESANLASTQSETNLISDAPSGGLSAGIRSNSSLVVKRRNNSAGSSSLATVGWIPESPDLTSSANESIRYPPSACFAL